MGSARADPMGNYWMNADSTDDINELVQQLTDRDPGSFERLYASYGSRIYRLAYGMTNNQADAEDITQETFLQVYRGINDFRGESQLYTWIYAIGKNVCYQVLRRRKRSTFDSFETLLLTALDTDWPCDVQTLENADRVDLIDQVKQGCLTGLLCCLSFHQRAAFVFHVLLHLPIRDVAEILGKSEGATKVLICRARANLKTFLCRNCFLYDPANHCHCESLLSFSLKQGWIHLHSVQQAQPIEPRQIENDIKTIRSVIDLYAHLPDPTRAEGLNQRLQSLIHNQEGILFSTRV